ncbi:MAG: glycoside hydrolase family 9 protein [Lachnospiraceae bacterium]|nr:glycoside hydrolase family 9 protein [Lachnospiraceae bacterium]
MKAKKILSIGLVTALTTSMLLAAGGCNRVVTPPEYPSETGSETPSEPEKKGGLEDGSVVIDDNFDDGKYAGWGTYSASGGSFKIGVEEGELFVDIASLGSLEYSVQVFKDGYPLSEGAVYTMEFDIRSDIERTLEWRHQINGGDYHAYYMEKDVAIGPETKHISVDWTMEDSSDPAPRLCFNLGAQGGLEGENPHKVYIDNVKLTVKDGSNALVPEELEPPVAIKVNQIGYLPDGEKVFTAPYDENVSEFTVKDASTGEVVYTGTLKDERLHSYSGDGSQRHGDFSDLREPGTYVISIEGYEDSYPFTIGENIYADVYKATVKMLTLQRCGTKVDKETGGVFLHRPCHMGEAVIYGTETKIDVSGGWHDAGDYGRYVVAGAKTVKDLFLAYTENEAATGDDFGIPESGNGVPDILDEARWELEFFLKMQADNGGVYHKVTCENFPGVVMPPDEIEQLVVCPISTTATGDFAAVMAEAYVIYKAIDADFANQCLDASKKAFAYMEKYAAADTEGFKNPEEIATGEYPDASNKDEFLWAAVELFLATGDNQYLQKAIEIEESGYSLGLGWASMGTYPAYDYLLYMKNGGEGSDRLQLNFMNRLTRIAKNDISLVEKDPYFVSLKDNYYWGSNMGIADNGIFYHMMYNLTGEEQYERYSKRAIDNLFGINPAGYCYVTGFGTHSPKHPHHRPSQKMGEAMPGMLVGGPDCYLEDPYAKAVLAGKRGGLCYIDNDSSYSTNEVTIYWNSPLIYLLSLQQ